MFNNAQREFTTDLSRRCRYSLGISSEELGTGVSCLPLIPLSSFLQSFPPQIRGRGNSTPGEAQPSACDGECAQNSS